MNTTLCDILTLLRDKELLLGVKNLNLSEWNTPLEEDIHSQDTHKHSCARDPQDAQPHCHSSNPSNPLHSEIRGVDCNSRYVDEGHLFICKGRAFKHTYLGQALEKGASAYLCDASRADELVRAYPYAIQIVVKDIRVAMGCVSPVGWGHPDEDLCVIGITGTKGKTSVSYMLRAILENDCARRNICAQNGKSPVGIIGSIETYDGDTSEESTNTTPEAPDLWRHLSCAKRCGMKYMVLEISSQALKYDRVLGLHVQCAAFLNISKDHISPVEHPTFEDYFASKLKIFELAETSVVNTDATHAQRIVRAALAHTDVCLCHTRMQVDASERGETYPPTLAHMKTELTREFPARAISLSEAKGARTTASGVSFSMDGIGELSLSLHGSFNISNALIAATIAQKLGCTSNSIQEGLACARVPGRMEFLESPMPYVRGIVDYAHNQLSFNKFFEAIIQEFPEYAITAVFGCPGGKAYERRQELPSEAARWADEIIFTEEDPAYENVLDICHEMATHLPDDFSYTIECDRARAIELAVAHARTRWEQNGQKTMICLLAKGDETTQHRGSVFETCAPDGELFARACMAYETDIHSKER